MNRNSQFPPVRHPSISRSLKTLSTRQSRTRNETNRCGEYKGGEVMKTLTEMKSGLHRHQNRELFEKTLDDDEIESLIDKARESALAIKNDKKREKEEREQAKEVLDFIDDVEGIGMRRNHFIHQKWFP